MPHHSAVEAATKTWFRPLLLSTLLTSAMGNILGLVFADSIYGQETDALADAALAQDAGTLGVCVTTILVLMRSHRRGTRELIGLGVGGFLAYNSVIYCFDITFGPLFLVWTLVLGLSVFTLASGFRALINGTLHTGEVRRTKSSAAVLIGVATLFATLWLIEITGDLAAGHGSISAASWNVPTNPVHVLDLAVALPATVITGFAVYQRRDLGVLAAPAALTFLIVMSIPIALTPVSSALQAHHTSWAPVAPVAGIAILCGWALWRILRPDRQDPGVPA